jgi:glycosyltransferase involved in cell wall biosynthesis
MLSLPLLSVCIPAYNRPVWLQRALQSVTNLNPQYCSEVEIVISDDSTDPTCGEVVRHLLASWQGVGKYTANNPSLGMAQNWNQAIAQARGKYVVVLHDDDFFLPRGIETLVNTLKSLREEYGVLLFGVRVVNESEQVLKTQTFLAAQYLAPREALIKLLSNSSLVRFPAICVERRVFSEVGSFNPQWGEPTDIDMWIRLFSRYGVYCVPQLTCAYTVHSQALTMGVFREETIKTLLGFFENVAASQILSDIELVDCQTKFLHQFLLAGAFRMLRRGRIKEFFQVINLFNLPEIKTLKIPYRWWLITLILRFLAKFNKYKSSKSSQNHQSPLDCQR